MYAQTCSPSAEEKQKWQAEEREFTEPEPTHRISLYVYNMHLCSNKQLFD